MPTKARSTDIVKILERVLDHDFLDMNLVRLYSYGVYVVNNNTGFVNL